MRRKLESIKTIIFHCLDVPPTKDFSIGDVDNWHRERGFAGVGYHFLIRKDGTIEYGRPLNIAGAHAKGFNHDSVGIATESGWKGEDTRTPECIASCHSLAESLVEVLPNIENIIGHNMVSEKSCPNYDAFKEYNYLLCGNS